MSANVPALFPVQLGGQSALRCQHVLRGHLHRRGHQCALRGPQGQRHHIAQVRQTTQTHESTACERPVTICRGGNLNLLRRMILIAQPQQQQAHWLVRRGHVGRAQAGRGAAPDQASDPQVHLCQMLPLLVSAQ